MSKHDRLSPLAKAMLTGASKFCDAIETGGSLEDQFRIRVVTVNAKPKFSRRVRPKLSTFELYGIIYAWSALPLLLLVITLGSRVSGWGVTACIGTVIVYILTGLGLLISIPLRPLFRTLDEKIVLPPSGRDPLWDRQIDP